MYARLGTVLLVGTAAIAGPALPAYAAPLHCGDTITTDVVLTKNLTCAGTALRVSIPGSATIHVDLNGHRLKGDGTGTGIELAPSSSLSGSLAVTNGTITGFDIALLRPRGGGFWVRNFSISRLRIVSNGWWMPQVVRQSAIVTDSTVVDSGQGGAYTDSATLTVTDSKFIRSDIYSASESFTTVSNSTFMGAGITTGAVANSIITNNSFTDCGTGVLITDGYALGPTTVEDNRFTHCQVGASIRMSGPVSVQGNTFSKNAVAGLQFTAQYPMDADIAGNRFSKNGGDGLSGSAAVSPAGPLPAVVRVTGNVAVGNAGYGINVSSVIDGGANKAKGNGNPAQCLGVTCTKP